MDIVAKKRELVKDLVRQLLVPREAEPDSELSVVEQFIVTVAVSEVAKILRERREVSHDGRELS